MPCCEAREARCLHPTSYRTSDADAGRETCVVRIGSVRGSIGHGVSGGEEVRSDEVRANTNKFPLRTV